jgi:large subunit ribosomal protein L33
MGDNVVVIALACSDCKRRNYSTKKNKQTHKEKMELKKYCRWCKHHTLHKETK